MSSHCLVSGGDQSSHNFFVHSGPYILVDVTLYVVDVTRKIKQINLFMDIYVYLKNSHMLLFGKLLTPSFM